MFMLETLCAFLNACVWQLNVVFFQMI